MTPLSTEILANYQIRKTKKQKDCFIRLMQSAYPNLQIQIGGSVKSRNLILGDVEQAKILLTAHYDTCAQLPFPNFITPKNPVIYVLYNLILIVPILIIMVLCSALLHLISENFLFNYFSVLALYVILFLLLLFGPANKHNANDNTSGVITLCELYARLTPDERSQVCFVFFDNEEAGLLGSRYFKKIYKRILSDKLLINFDCVSDGNYILFALNKGIRKHWTIDKYFTANSCKVPLFEKAERVIYPSDQNGFPNTVAVAALKKRKLIGHYMNRIHTKKDTVFDEKNIDFLCNGFHALIADVCGSKKSLNMKCCEDNYDEP